MDLLERYLHAVGQHLPAKGRADTLAELRANLLAQIEGHEEELGRPLTEAEVATILEKHGRPVLVATQYRPKQYLIGPELFPIYWITIKRSLPLLILAYAAIQVVAVILHRDSSFNVMTAVGNLPGVLLTFWAVMTLGFAIFEFAQGRYFAEIKLPATWNPRDLPPIATQQKGPSLTSGLADLIVHILAIVWLLIIPYKPVLLLGPGLGYLREMPFGLTPEWHTLYWQIICLLALMLTLKAVSLFRNLGKWRSGLQIAEQLLGIGILVVLVAAQTYFVPMAGLTAHNLASLIAFNALLNLGFKIALVVRVFKLLWDLWKMYSQPVVSRTAMV